MRTITVSIEYSKISPAVLACTLEKNLMGWCGWTDSFEGDTFEFWVQCRQEDAAQVEKVLAPYV